MEKPQITYADFARLDIRVGTIIEATVPEWSNKLIQLKVDFGAEIGQRTIFSGIRRWYQPTDVLNKQAVFLINLQPKKMGEYLSEGMMLMADGEVPMILSLPETVGNGTAVG